MVINGYCDTSAEKLNRAGSYQRWICWDQSCYGSWGSTEELESSQVGRWWWRWFFHHQPRGARDRAPSAQTSVQKHKNHLPSPSQQRFCVSGERWTSRNGVLRQIATEKLTFETLRRSGFWEKVRDVCRGDSKSHAGIWCFCRSTWLLLHSFRIYQLSHSTAAGISYYNKTADMFTVQMLL